MSKAKNIIRELRLQLKTGFLRSEPAAYTFMKRYPPLGRDTKPSFHQIEEKNIPYLGLYDKIVAQNPLYNDERVYPAYWQSEPQALVLAKKQYEYLSQGMNEEDAYAKALEFVDELENESYLKLKELKESLEASGAQAPFMANDAVATEIKYWLKQLENTSYDDLSLADQGEIDYLIQIKILKWNEVERERRMKDPIFVMQFDRIRESLFPSGQELAAKIKAASREDYKDRFLKLNDVSKDLLNSKAAFFMEDYIKFFEVLKAQPDVRKLSIDVRDSLNMWITDTLAMREITEKQPNYKIQKYLDDVRFHFFPMIRFPHRAAEMKTPTVESLKQVLFHNDIGYKRMDGKVFVKRFYKIPQLLFPKEIFTASIISNEDRFRAIMGEEQELLKEMSLAGIDEASAPELKKQLQEYLTDSKLGMPNYSAGDEIDMSALDDILSDVFNDSSSAANKKKKASDLTEDNLKKAGAAGAASGDIESGSDSSSLSSSSSSSSDSDDDAVAAARRASSSNSSAVDRFKMVPLTHLERERDDLYAQVEHNKREDVEDELDMMAFQAYR